MGGGFLGIMLLIFLWLPETPCKLSIPLSYLTWQLILKSAYYAARGLHDQGKAVLRRVNGNVKGYHVEAEYEVIKNIIIEEQERLELLGIKDQSWRSILKSYVECFRGPNLVHILSWPFREL